MPHPSGVSLSDLIKNVPVTPPANSRRRDGLGDPVEKREADCQSSVNEFEANLQWTFASQPGDGGDVQPNACGYDGERHLW